MKVSLRQNFSPATTRQSSQAGPPLPLLSLSGPEVILGGHTAADGLAAPVQPSAESLFGPRGVALAGAAGPLFVADTGHHRLLIWQRRPETDRVPADIVIGQADFACEGRNAHGIPGASTLNVPTGLAASGNVLAVADAWNHRVLIWHGYPGRHNQPADIVLGQANFAGVLPNRGQDRPRADTLNWCYGVAICGTRLVVADTGNRRVLVWERIPEASGAPAGLVLGQTDFTCRDENAGLGVGAVAMRWPHAVAAAGPALLVADAGNNRVMVWRAMPSANGAPCDAVLGQADFVSAEHNRAAYYPGADTLNMPYGLACLDETVIVADTANSRLLGFNTGALEMGAPGTHLAGQHGFADKGDNRWAPAARDSFCWPYGVAVGGRYVAIADSGNNRISLWQVA
jgi:hypothetical protein